MRTATSLLFFLAPLFVLADPHTPDARLHRRHKQRAEMSRLESRGFRATFYDVGLGACGKTNSDDEFVIALNIPQYAGGSHCGDMVTISYKGKSTQAKVVDECVGCPYGAIDMSPSLFSFFADQSEGTINVDWDFGGGGGGGDDPKPTSSKKPAPKPTSTSSSSTYKAPKTTSTTSTSSSSSTTTSSTSTSTTSAATTSYTPVPTPTPTPIAPQNFADLESIVGALGQLVLSAAL